MTNDDLTPKEMGDRLQHLHNLVLERDSEIHALRLERRHLHRVIQRLKDDILLLVSKEVE